MKRLYLYRYLGLGFMCSNVWAFRAQAENIVIARGPAAQVIYLALGKEKTSEDVTIANVGYVMQMTKQTKQRGLFSCRFEPNLAVNEQDQRLGYICNLEIEAEDLIVRHSVSSDVYEGRSAEAMYEALQVKVSETGGKNAGNLSCTSSLASTTEPGGFYQCILSRDSQPTREGNEPA